MQFQMFDITFLCYCLYKQPILFPGGNQPIGIWGVIAVPGFSSYILSLFSPIRTNQYQKRWKDAEFMTSTCYYFHNKLWDITTMKKGLTNQH